MTPLFIATLTVSLVFYSFVASPVAADNEQRFAVRNIIKQRFKCPLGFGLIVFLGRYSIKRYLHTGKRCKARSFAATFESFVH